MFYLDPQNKSQCWKNLVAGLCSYLCNYMLLMWV